MTSKGWSRSSIAKGGSWKRETWGAARSFGARAVRLLEAEAGDGSGWTREMKWGAEKSQEKMMMAT